MVFLVSDHDSFVSATIVRNRVIRNQPASNMAFILRIISAAVVFLLRMFSNFGQAVLHAIELIVLWFIGVQLILNRTGSINI